MSFNNVIPGSMIADMDDEDIDLFFTMMYAVTDEQVDAAVRAIVANRERDKEVVSE